jgi:hypothetical protein
VTNDGEFHEKRRIPLLQTAGYTTASMRRVVLAVALGLAFIAGLMFATDQMFGFTIDGWESLPVKPVFYFIFTIATTAVYSVLGGWACAATARPQIRSAVRGLVIVGLCLGIGLTVWLWKALPHYYCFALLAVYLPGVRFGAKTFEWTRPDAE